MKHYDYIIAGAGAAGLSLLMYMMQHPHFETKQILVVDKSAKDKNDRTWCFWEEHPGIFEPVVHHKWQQVHFYSNHYSGLLNLYPFQYKMIRAIDFYNYTVAEASKHPNVTFRYGMVEALSNEVSKASVLIDGEKVSADYVFNSIMFGAPNIPANKYYLLQHFKGWMIETTEPAFNPLEATLMDFRVRQHHGTTFGYVLPQSTTRALVEYTLFTKQLLAEEEYNAGLRNYISAFLNIQDYTVVEEEFGVIPMTNYKFPSGEGRVIHIGTAGGQTKPSSGYTFRFVQKHANAIVQSLVHSGHPYLKRPFSAKRFDFYDNTFLSVLYNEKLKGDKVFSDLFSKNAPERILRFLDNESTLEDELNILGSLPGLVFTKAAIHEMFT